MLRQDWRPDVRPGTAGFMGARCEGRVAPLMLEEGVGGAVDRGTWSFLSLPLGDDDSSWKKVRCCRPPC